MVKTNKITKLQVVEMMLADEVVCANADYKNYLENERDILIKKRDNKKATKTQTENIGVKSVILDVLANASNPMTITDIQNSNSELKALSNQKISALVKQLKDNGDVVKTVEKGKSLFALADEDVE